MKGKIKTIVDGKGFGFIAQDDREPDAFFHYRDLIRGLEFGQELIGMEVLFDVHGTERGPRALSVRPAN